MYLGTSFVYSAPGFHFGRDSWDHFKVHMYFCRCWGLICRDAVYSIPPIYWPTNCDVMPTTAIKCRIPGWNNIFYNVTSSVLVMIRAYWQLVNVARFSPLPTCRQSMEFWSPGDVSRISSETLSKLTFFKIINTKKYNKIKTMRIGGKLHATVKEILNEFLSKI
jgi:hypothetical protein